MTNSYIYRLTKVKELLETLSINEESNALWDVLHQASWHKGIDWIRWIDDNQELIKILIHYKYFSESPKEIQSEVWNSIYKIKNLDR